MGLLYALQNDTKWLHLVTISKKTAFEDHTSGRDASAMCDPSLAVSHRDSHLQLKQLLNCPTKILLHAMMERFVEP